jgi:crossover junction endodeoxyribonuclease RuvC
MRAKRKGKYFVGLDPSLTGFGVCNYRSMEDFKTHSFTSRKMTGLYDRYERYNTLVDSVLDSLPSPKEVAVVCIEGLVPGPGVTTLQLAELGTLVRQALIGKYELVIEATNTQAKKFWTGAGNSNKTAMILSTFKRCGIEFKSDDENDAFVLAKLAACVDGAEPAPIKSGARVIEVLKSKIT